MLEAAAQRRAAQPTTPTAPAMSVPVLDVNRVYRVGGDVIDDAGRALCLMRVISWIEKARTAIEEIHAWRGHHPELESALHDLGVRTADATWDSDVSEGFDYLLLDVTTALRDVSRAWREPSAVATPPRAVRR